MSQRWKKYYSEKVINAKLPEDTIYGYVKSKNQNNYDRVAIKYFGIQLTYQELFQKIDECAGALSFLGVKTGDVVSICMPTTPEVVFLFYGLSKIGAISNMIDPRKSEKEIEEYCAEVNSKVFFGIDLAWNKLLNLRRNSSVEKVIIISPYESFKRPIKQLLKAKSRISSNSLKTRETKDRIWWEQFIKKGSGERVKECKYKRDMPVTIVHTGGTTGKAKGVVLSNDNINCGAFQCEICGLDFSDRGTWLDIMPPFIAYGVGNGLHLPLSMGMKVVLLPRFNPVRYDKILLKYKPNYMAGVPSHYSYLLKSIKLKNIDLSFIKTPIVGGDKMDYTLEEEVNEFLADHNCKSKIVKGYGMSEVNAAVSVCITNDVNKLKSVGIPLPHSDIRIFDPNENKELGVNEFGELRISGPNVMLGYYNDPEEDRKVLYADEQGVRWVRSGDLGYMDEDGILYVKGRYKEMIVRADGFKIYPSSIEEVILMHDDVAECKVIGGKDLQESQGELPKAVIVLNETERDKNVIIEEIKGLCKENLAEYSLPHEYSVTKKLPMTSIGKIDIIALKNSF